MDYLLPNELQISDFINLCHFALGFPVRAKRKRDEEGHLLSSSRIPPFAMLCCNLLFAAVAAAVTFVSLARLPEMEEGEEQDDSIFAENQVPS